MEQAWLETLPEADVAVLYIPGLFATSAAVRCHVDPNGFNLDLEFMAFHMFRLAEV